MMKDNRIRGWSSLSWRRPKDVYGEGNFVLYDKPDPCDIKQGKCGDCYFLSSLSSLAEYPDRIKRIFITKEVNDAGIYAVHLYINGEKRTVVVDDYFPYDEDKETWAFSRPSHSSEIWVLVLEKAWAKVFGSYQRIEAGTAGEALYPLTGSPHKFFIHDDIRDKDYIWGRILKSDQLKHPMTTAVASMAQEGMDHRTVKAQGLVDAHAYSLIAAKEVTLDNGKKERLVQVRNPWGKKEWNGDWSDNSDKWTEGLKRQVDFENKNDGIFWIAFNDYIQFFYMTTICFFNEKYEDNFTTDEHPVSEFGIVKFTMEKEHPTPISIAVDQINSRFVDETMLGNYEYPAIKVMLVKVDPVAGTQKYIGGTRDFDTHVCCTRYSLEKG